MVESESSTRGDVLEAGVELLPLWVGIGAVAFIAGCLLLRYICIKKAQRDEERMNRASQRMAMRAQANSVYMSKKRLAKKKAGKPAAVDDNEPPNSARALIKKEGERDQPR